MWMNLCTTLTDICILYKKLPYWQLHGCVPRRDLQVLNLTTLNIQNLRLWMVKAFRTNFKEILSFIGIKCTVCLACSRHCHMWPLQEEGTITSVTWNVTECVVNIAVESSLNELTMWSSLNVSNVNEFQEYSQNYDTSRMCSSHPYFTFYQFKRVCEADLIPELIYLVWLRVRQKLGYLYK